MDDVGLREFYSGQTIFVTGATGFLGRVITEKLLRTCPDVKKIYLLIRTKKGKDSQERINELFNDPVFDPMKNANSEYKSKVSLIAGDLSVPDIGMSESDRKTLIDEVTVVFHGGATVRFDEKLKTAIGINVAGTKDVLLLCGECRNLKALVHISTAYTNCYKDDVDERLHPPPIPGDEVIHLAKTIPEDILESCCPMVIHGWPNTYAFSKQIAEDLVRSEALAKRIPVAVYRPAVVIGAHQEPIPGWIDNIYGPTGVTAAVAAGLLRTMPADSNLKAELVPIDLTVNAALAIAWDVARINRNDANVSERTQDTEVPVYNFVTAKENPVTWGDFQEFQMRTRYEIPSVKTIWYCSLLCTKYPKFYYFYSFLVHLFPALLIDTALLIMRREPQALKIYRKVEKFLGVISYFSLREWNFQDDNLKGLWKRLSEEDKRLFNFDMNCVNWSMFFKANLRAMRIFLFHDTMDTVAAGRKKMFKLYLLHRLVQILFVTFLVWILWTPTVIIFKWIGDLTILHNEETSVKSVSRLSLSRVG